MAHITQKRSEIIHNLASTYWHLTQDGGLGDADRDVLMLVLHALRDSLRNTTCPSCAEIQLAKELDSATSQEG
jgi:hypothetical protein